MTAAEKQQQAMSQRDANLTSRQAKCESDTMELNRRVKEVASKEHELKQSARRLKQSSKEMEHVKKVLQSAVACHAILGGGGHEVPSMKKIAFWGKSCELRKIASSVIVYAKRQNSEEVYMCPLCSMGEYMPGVWVAAWAIERWFLLCCMDVISKQSEHVQQPDGSTGTPDH